MWLTEIKAYCPKDNQVKKWVGPNVPGETEEEARKYCDENDLGYCKIVAKINTNT